MGECISDYSCFDKLKTTGSDISTSRLYALMYMYHTSTVLCKRVVNEQYAPLPALSAGMCCCGHVWFRHICLCDIVLVSISGH